MSGKDITPAPLYKKSRRSGNQGDSCVEVALNIPRRAYVRDSKDAEGPELVVPAADWYALTAALKTGHVGL